jgi:hypothetical protein
VNNQFNKFNIIKSQVKQLIQENLYREVTTETKHNISGIYMIYVDKFTSENIIPIYIGKAKDIQKRYKQHYTEILALNRLTYEEYHKYFFINSHSFYEGKFKSCKIFKYMLENNCSLKDLRMIVLEKVEVEYLDEKEKEYFQRLLPSFFGFNQLNSFLKRLSFRFSKAQMTNVDIYEYLNELQEDIEGIYSFYNYGFTRFNFEHSIPTDISYLMKTSEHLDHEMLLKIDEVNLSLYKLCKCFIPDFDRLQRIRKKKNKLYEVYKTAGNESYEALKLLQSNVTKEFEQLKIYNEKAVKSFIYSIEYKNNHKYKEFFHKYLKSIKCNIDFYELFNKQIKEVSQKIEERNNKNIPYSEVADSYTKIDAEKRLERYKLIFPSCEFESFSLGDRAKNIILNIDNKLFNICYIQIYISNNAINKSFEIRKEPFIIRIDYCFVDNKGNKIEKIYYIDNETTRNCQSGIEYIEKDFYDIWAVKQEGFKISSIINKEIDHSFISVLAEFKHGINDCTIKNKQLVKLLDVLDEIQHITNDKTGFNVDVSESSRCLKICIENEGLQNNPFVEKLLKNNLPKIKKVRKSSVKRV